MKKQNKQALKTEQKTTEVDTVEENKVDEKDDRSDVKEKENDDERDEESEEDEDYDPDAPEDEEEEEDDEPIPDYSAITSDKSLVRTRSRAQQEAQLEKDSGRGIKRTITGLVANTSTIDVDSIFKELKLGSELEWKLLVRELQPETEPETEPEVGSQQIKIETTYAFAGKLISESKFVDASSAEAKAYLNSVAQLNQKTKTKRNGSSIPVMRKMVKLSAEKASGVANENGSKELEDGAEIEKTNDKNGIKDERDEELVALRIKLKRPSLIDKFILHGNKTNALSTLEKSRLDWASFVDSDQLQDELRIANKDGYLEKQDFLLRLEQKQDAQFQEARVKERQRQWALEDRK